MVGRNLGPIDRDSCGSFRFPTATVNFNLQGSWDEPDSALRNNVAVIYNATTDLWSIGAQSDANANTSPHYANGATATYSGDTVSFNVRFIDQGDAVPEGGATVIMLSLAVGCLAIMRRRITAA